MTSSVTTSTGGGRVVSPSAATVGVSDRLLDSGMSQARKQATTTTTTASAARVVGRQQSSQYLEFAICPEVGLSKQAFKCADCQDAITFACSRICDYDGLYYCLSCHWNDLERTPARMMHNWDATAKPVSRRSLQLITYIKRQPVLFDVLDFNPMLYGLLEDLPLIKVCSCC